MIQVLTHNQIIGFHCWPDAPERYAYLSKLHRHVFVIRCRFDVSHTDRQIEINDMQDVIDRTIRKRYQHDDIVCFGSMSCEDIAQYCIDTFGCVSCEVLEDGFGGGYVGE